MLGVAEDSATRDEALRQLRRQRCGCNLVTADRYNSPAKRRERCRGVSIGGRQHLPSPQYSRGCHDLEFTGYSAKPSDLDSLLHVGPRSFSSSCETADILGGLHGASFRIEQPTMVPGRSDFSDQISTAQHL